MSELIQLKPRGRKDVLLRKENTTLLAKHREEFPYEREDRKEVFLDKWRIVRIISHLLSIGTLAVGIWIVVEVNHFYNIAYSLADQSGYKGDLQIRFLQECFAVGCTLITAATIGIIFGIFSLPLDKKLSEKHRIIFPTVQWLLTCAVIIVEVTAGILLWRKGVQAHPSLELTAYTQQYTSLPTEMSTDGSIIVTSSLDNAISDPGVLRTTIIFNALQMKMKCCDSISGYEDFHDSLYFSETFPVFVPPVFCCKFASSTMRTLNDKACYSAANRFSDNISNAHKGCVAEVTEYRHRDFPIMVGIVVSVVMLKIIAHLIELTTKCFRSDSAWRNAKTQCTVSINRLTNDLILEPVDPHNIKEAQESYVDNLTKLDVSREAIAKRMNNIVGCLRKRQPGQLSEEYRHLANDVLGLADDCKHALWRISQCNPFHTVELFDLHTSEQLSASLRKMRKSCEAVISEPMLEDAQKRKLCKRLLRGAFYAYCQCHRASQEAANSATFELFTEYAEEVITSAGALLNDLQSAIPDDMLMRTEAQRLKNVGYKIGTYFTASSLLTLDTHSHPHADAEAQIKHLVKELVQSVVGFLEEAQALTVADGGRGRFRDRRTALGKYRGGIVKGMDELYKCIEHMVPGLMDCTSILKDIDSLRESNWQKLIELADQKRPLADFCEYFFDISNMVKVLDSIGRVVTSKRSPDIVYKMGRRIIQLDSHRRFLQLETCGLASKTANPGNGHKMVDILQTILLHSSELLHNCHAHLTNPHDFLKSKVEILSIQILIEQIKVELDSLNKLHQEIKRSHGYQFCSNLDEASIVPDGETAQSFDFSELIAKLPKETFKPYPQRVAKESDDVLASNQSSWRNSVAELDESSVHLDDTANPSQFRKALQEIDPILRLLRLKCELQERIHTDHKQRGHFSGSQVVPEVNAFRAHVDQLISTAKLEHDTEAARVVGFSFYAVKRLYDTCEAAASRSMPREIRTRLLQACLSAVESFSNLIKFVEEKFKRANQSSQSESLSDLQEAAETNLRLIELTLQNASTVLLNGHTRAVKD